MIGLCRQFKISYANYTVLFQLQRVLAQQLFYPPNVAGWQGGKSYIDSSTLLLRMKLPAVLLNNGQLGVPDKIDDPDDQATIQPQVNKKYETEVNWSGILEEVSDLNFDKLLKLYLLKTPYNAVIAKIKSDSFLNNKEIILKIISLPEYNLM